MIESRPGLIVFRASSTPQSPPGTGAAATFRDEPGGHRWQHVPATEKRGRVQTSTITVAILPVPDVTNTKVVLQERDLEWQACRGSGAGGQHRNVTASAVQLRHVPSGLTVRCENERSQHQNLQVAKSVLRARLWELERARVSGERAGDRKAQVGSGMRGDKRRTIRVQDGQVVDHVTGRKWEFKRYARGDWD